MAPSSVGLDCVLRLAVCNCVGYFEGSGTDGSIDAEFVDASGFELCTGLGSDRRADRARINRQRKKAIFSIFKKKKTAF